MPDAITNLRESGDIPWDAIVDQTRSLDNYTGWSNLTAGLDAYLNAVELDPRHGAARLITLRCTQRQPLIINK